MVKKDQDPGREAAIRALQACGLEVTSIRDMSVPPPVDAVHQTIEGQIELEVSQDGSR